MQCQRMHCGFEVNMHHHKISIYFRFRLNEQRTHFELSRKSRNWRKNLRQIFTPPDVESYISDIPEECLQVPGVFPSSQTSLVGCCHVSWTFLLHTLVLGLPAGCQSTWRISEITLPLKVNREFRCTEADTEILCVCNEIKCASLVSGLL